MSKKLKNKSNQASSIMQTTTILHTMPVKVLQRKNKRRQWLRKWQTDYEFKKIYCVVGTDVHIIK